MQIPTIQLKRSIKDRILDECIQKKPNEACGFVWGTANFSWIHVEAFDSVPNCASNPSIQFSMDPVSLIPILTSKIGSGLEVVGIVHSHPTAAAIPSHEDLLTSWHQLPSHWIVSLQQPTPYIAAYQYVRLEGVDQDFSHSMHYRPIPITIIQG
ncbi:Mov34/MPN/PAD-1 family protein [Paenibacillus agricola]|uniref:M67 family metallopeptidase n=1 Tax=Paenibacillus agricola TaxID=2716264 RepID=A0ABX0J8T7_9BACL|nr:M67 family metallopeptidase [Paenibacillus agricola]NHN31243.1 M67 family metallopeptidase [Paenibacillus agricola]